MFCITVSRMSCSLRLRKTSADFLESWSRLIFRALLSCFFDWGKGFTRLRCQVFQARSETSMNRSARSRIWSARLSFVRSLGVTETDSLSGLESSCMSRGIANTSLLESIWQIVSLACGAASLNAIFDLIIRLSIWQINRSRSSMTDASYQTLCATKMNWCCLA